MPSHIQLDFQSQDLITAIWGCWRRTKIWISWKQLRKWKIIISKINLKALVSI